MPAFQQTFNLIPANPSNAAPKPPMTSKAAKKAYLKANRGPRISRAEQRRLEKEELDKQKKEYEKERNAAKAKSVRERKAAKIAEEKDNRRKAGLPEPSRFVRASQPTISMFARAGGKRVWQQIEMESVEEDSEDTMGEENLQPVDRAEPPAKRVAEEQESDEEFGVFPSMSQADALLEKIDSSNVSIVEEETGPKASSKSKYKDSPDFGNFPTLSHLSQEIDTLPIGSNSKLRSSPRLRREVSPKDPVFRRNSQKLPKQKPKTPQEETPLISQMLADLATTQLQSEVAEAEARSDPADQPVLQKSPGSITIAKPLSPSYTTRSSGRNPINNSKRRSPTNSTLQQRSVNLPPPKGPLPPRDLPQNRSADAIALPKQIAQKTVPEKCFRDMPPPPMPTAGRKAAFIAPCPNRSKAVPANMPKNRFAKRAENIPPTPTQLFLENNLDDFLPSPSQEIQELLDDIEDFPSNTQIAKEVGLMEPTPRLNPAFESKDHCFRDLFSTQDIAMSSQDLLEISTPSRPPPVRSSNRRLTIPPAKFPDTTARSQQPTHLIHSNRGRTKPADSTTIPAQIARQSNSTPLSKMPHHAPKLNPRASATLSAPKAEVPNVTAVKQTTRKFSMPSRPVPPVPPKIPIPPPPKRRFFQEKEDDLYHAAIDESNRLECKRIAEEKARKAHLMAKPMIPAARTRSERTLQRVQSAATDYGDDDFISSQELLALC